MENINVIVTMAYGRAGSVLMQSLFDGHPNVLTLPHLGPMYSLIPAAIGDLDRQIDWFIRKFPAIFDTSRGYFGDLQFVSAKFGPRGDEDLRVSCTEFKSKLMEHVRHYRGDDTDCTLSRKEFFILAHIAYSACVKALDVSDVRYIFYHVHEYKRDEWQGLLEDFPDLYLLAMTRDPRQDWASWKKWHALRMQRDISDVPPICLFLSEYNYSGGCYDLSNLVERLNRDHIRTIDLEELHIFNKAALLRLCEWLGIEFHECLLQSTFNGRQWHGNAASGKKASALNPNRTREGWQNELTEGDRQIITALMPGSLRYFGYDTEDPASCAGRQDTLRGLKYRSATALFVHCVLYISAGNPFRHLRRKIGLGRKVRSILRDFYRGASLFLQMRGNGLDRKLAEMLEQQNELVRKDPPPRLMWNPSSPASERSAPGGEMCRAAISPDTSRS